MANINRTSPTSATYCHNSRFMKLHWVISASGKALLMWMSASHSLAQQQNIGLRLSSKSIVQLCWNYLQEMIMCSCTATLLHTSLALWNRAFPGGVQKYLCHCETHCLGIIQMYNEAKVQNMQRDPPQSRCGKPVCCEQKLWLWLHCRYCSLQLMEGFHPYRPCCFMWQAAITSPHKDWYWQGGAGKEGELLRSNPFPIRMSHGGYLSWPVCLVSFAKTQECRQEGSCCTEQ